MTMHSNKLDRIPPYILAAVTSAMKVTHPAKGEDIIDFGMGNPDMATPQHIVDKLVEAVRNSANHRYSVSRGIFKLREAVCKWYDRRFGVQLDPDTEAIATIGAKEGISHFMLRLVESRRHGDRAHALLSHSCLFRGAGRRQCDQHSLQTGRGHIAQDHGDHQKFLAQAQSFDPFLPRTIPRARS